MPTESIGNYSLPLCFNWPQIEVYICGVFLKYIYNIPPTLAKPPLLYLFYIVE